MRHAAPDVDPRRPAHDWPLSAEGRRSSERLAERLAPLHPDAVFSSAEPKAEETAAIVARALGLTHARIRALGEHDRRDVPFFADPREFERRVEALFERPRERVFGGESADESLERFTRGLEEVLRRRHARPVVVSHGTVLSLYLARRAGRAAVDLWREWAMPSWSVIGPGAATPRIRPVGDEPP